MHHLLILNICTDCRFCSYGLVELRKKEKETDFMVLATGKIKQLAKCALFLLHTDNIWVDGHTVPVCKYLSVCKENLSFYCPVLYTIILVNTIGFLIRIKTIFKTKGLWKKNLTYLFKLNSLYWFYGLACFW